MRDVVRVGTVLAGCLLTMGLAACSNAGLQSSFPAGPSGIGRDVSFGPGATFATDHTPPPPESDTLDNPCTGQNVTVYITPVKAAWRPDGGFSIVADVTTSDGFSGRLTYTGTDPATRGNSGVVEERFTGRATLRNGSGQVMLYQGDLRVVMVDGKTIVEVDEESLTCVGKPV